MGQVHNALRRGELSAALTRALGDARAEGGLERYGETLTPTLDLWRRLEHAFLRGEHVFARRVASPVVALRFSSIELTLAADSGTIAVVMARNVGASITEAQIDSGAAIGANPVLSRGLAMDDRYPILGEGSRVLITAGDLATGASLAQVAYTASTSPQPDEHWSWVLVPGSKLFFVGASAGDGLDMNLRWYERQAFGSEL